MSDDYATRKRRQQQNAANRRRAEQGMSLRREADVRAAAKLPGVNARLAPPGKTPAKPVKNPKAHRSETAANAFAQERRVLEATAITPSDMRRLRRTISREKVERYRAAWQIGDRPAPLVSDFLRPTAAGRIARAGKAQLRLDRMKLARVNLLDFMQFVMPDPKHHDNASFSLYRPGFHHQIIADKLEAMLDGDEHRIILTCPPRHGKTQLASIGYIAWWLGQRPHQSVILGTYNSDYAEDIGRQVRDLMLTAEYRLVFPKTELKTDSRAADRIKTTAGGGAYFVGRGGAVTGRGGDLLIVDDPLKDDAEASSPTIRQKLWEWFNKTFMTRGMTDQVRALVIQTRWHEDDLIGRLTDPANPDFREEEARKWTKIDMPAICVNPDDDPLGRELGDPLWPQRFSAPYLNSLRNRDPLGFSALYQCSPAPPEGILFTRDCLRTYQRGQLPANLRVYMASDHAVSTKQQRDKTCILAGGVDEDDNLWILPDAFWRQASSDQVVDGMLHMIKTHKPLIWWAEGGAIGKSLGPFLRKRMQEESTYCAIHEVTPANDKLTRAQAIHGRAMMGKVFFPAFAPWWVEAQDELMKFPTGVHDDFVDALSHLGRGLGMMAGNRIPKDRREDTGPAVGTLAWVKAQSLREAAARRSANWNGW